MDSTSFLLLALKLMGLAVGGLAAVMQVRSSPDQPLTKYQRALALTIMGGLLVVGLAEVVGTTQQLRTGKESDAREARLLSEVKRLTRPLFPIGISSRWNVPVDGNEFKPYAYSWEKLLDDTRKPDTWPLSDADLPPAGTAGRRILEQCAHLEIRIYGLDRTSRNAFDQPDVLIHVDDASRHEYNPSVPTGQHMSLSNRSYTYRRGGSIDFIDAPATVARGAFNSGGVAFEDDLVGSTIEIGIVGREGESTQPAFRELIVHLRGQRNLHIRRDEFRRSKSEYGDWVYRAVVTPVHIARAAIMEP